MDLRCSTHPPPPSSDEDEDEEDEEDDALVMTLVAVPRRLVFTQKLLFVCFLSKSPIIIIVRLLPEKKSLDDFTKTREAPRLPRGGSAPPLFFLCDQCPPAKEFFFFVFANDENVALGPLDKEATCDEHKCIVVVVVIFRALLKKEKKARSTPSSSSSSRSSSSLPKAALAPENEDATPTHTSV